MLCLWLLTCLRTLRGDSGLILSSCCYFWCIYYPLCCFECSRLLQTSPSLSMLAQMFLHTPPLVPNAVGMCWTGIFSQAALGVLSGVVEPSLHCSGFFCSWAVILSASVLPLLCLHIAVCGEWHEGARSLSLVRPLLPPHHHRVSADSGIRSDVISCHLPDGSWLFLMILVLMILPVSSWPPSIPQYNVGSLECHY